MAVEDACILSNLLGQCHVPSDITAAFTAYDAVRVERTCKIVDASREQGRMADMESEGIGSNLEKIRAELGWEKRMWMWGWKPEEGLKVATRIFEKEKEKDKDSS